MTEEKKPLENETPAVDFGAPAEPVAADPIAVEPAAAAPATPAIDFGAPAEPVAEPAVEAAAAPAEPVAAPAAPVAESAPAAYQAAAPAAPAVTPAPPAYTAQPISPAYTPTGAQQQPAYGVQAPQQPAFAVPAQPVADERPKGLAVTALVTGIAGFLFTIILPFGAIIGLVAVGFGIAAAVKKQHKGMWITGLVLGVLAILGTIALFGLALWALSLAGDPYMQEQLLQSGVTQQELLELQRMLELLSS